MTEIWQGLLWPLLRLLAGLAAGLFLATILESLRLTDFLANLGRPLARLAHLGGIGASTFALSFVSPTAANGLLAENYADKKIGPRELLLSNLFNGLPATFSHMRAMLFLLWPVLGSGALLYVGLSLLAAALRTSLTIFLGRMLLPWPGGESNLSPAREYVAPKNFRMAFGRGVRCFCRRLPKLVYFTAPVCALMYFCQHYGLFNALEGCLSAHLSWLPVVKPQAMSIVALQIFAELGATLGAASAVIGQGALDVRDVVMALLVGNVISTPIRAIRHQFPAYAGFFRPSMAFKLVLANQALRVLTMLAVIWVYYATFMA